MRKKTFSGPNTALAELLSEVRAEMRAEKDAEIASLKERLRLVGHQVINLHEERDQLKQRVAELERPWRLMDCRCGARMTISLARTKAQTRRQIKRPSLEPASHR